MAKEREQQAPAVEPAGEELDLDQLDDVTGGVKVEVDTGTLRRFG